MANGIVLVVQPYVFPEARQETLTTCYIFFWLPTEVGSLLRTAGELSAKHEPVGIRVISCPLKNL